MTISPDTWAGTKTPMPMTLIQKMKAAGHTCADGTNTSQIYRDAIQYWAVVFSQSPNVSTSHSVLRLYSKKHGMATFDGALNFIKYAIDAGRMEGVFLNMDHIFYMDTESLRGYEAGFRFGEAIEEIFTD